MFCVKLFDGRFLYSDGYLRSIVIIGWNRRDLVNGFHTRDDLAECGVLTVKMRRVGVHNKELRGCGVGVKRPRHRDNAARVLYSVIPAVCAELSLDVFLCAAHTVAERVAALDHKAGDDSMEGETVVESLGNELLKVLYGDGRRVGIKLYLDPCAVFHFNNYHSFFSLYDFVVFYLRANAGAFFVFNVIFISARAIIYYRTMEFAEGKMKRERLEYAVLILIVLVGGGVLLFVLMRHILPAVLPFIIAWCVAFAVRAPSRRLSERLRIPERVIRPLFAILITLLLFSAVGLILWQLVTLVWNTLTEIGEGNNPVYDLLYSLSEGRHTIFGELIPEELAAKMSDALGELLTSALTRIAGAVTWLVGAIPGALLFVLVTVIALIYFAIDLEKINARVRCLLPKSVADGLSRARRKFFSLGGRYLGSYLVIFGITFVIMLLGLLVLRIRAAFLVALIIAFLDLLPVIGVGTVLIPWSIIGFATGDHFIGIGMLVLFVVNTIVRELLEPRILGKNLGIHPILSLVLIYAGYAIFGFTGLLVTPILAGIIGLVTERDKGGSQEE